MRRQTEIVERARFGVVEDHLRRKHFPNLHRFEMGFLGQVRG